MVKFKTIFGADVRRFDVHNADLTFDMLKSRIIQLYGIDMNMNTVAIRAATDQSTEKFAINNDEQLEDYLLQFRERYRLNGKLAVANEVNGKQRKRSNEVVEEAVIPAMKIYVIVNVRRLQDDELFDDGGFEIVRAEEEHDLRVDDDWVSVNDETINQELAILDEDEKAAASAEAVAAEVIKHENYACNICGQNPIIGIRYRCNQCKDFDICEQCEEQGGHTQDHALLMIRIPEVEIPKLPRKLQKKYSKQLEQLEVMGFGKDPNLNVFLLEKFGGDTERVVEWHLGNDR